MSIQEYNKSGMLNTAKEYVNHELTNIEEYQYIDNLLTSKKIYNNNELLVEIKYRYINDSIPNRKFILETPIGNKNIKEKTLKEINEKGYLINEINNPFNSFSIKKTNYQYNENNKVIRVNKYGHENNLYMKEIYQYGKNGITELYKLVDSKDNLIDYELLSEVEYDSKGNPIYIVSKDSIQAKMIYEFEYEYY
ncbi:hypothetical protein [Wenyingzhuangia sp. 2_MG-2023]|uniref:hypothetical protein n=1 Tax=Wenyingzhuangia sp. 2_MG-2023 TaxID=3062639 RepID=UPI0026E48175|nr:hypothetical protein [Wenyingzhuangia sp. 2_MG-2023]MDO6739485.1 hypothetical protein [Wenyingzhuangia sp. 2_MG-2023]